MRLKKLLRKNIEPRCTYCAHGSPLADGERIACRKRGVVNGTDHCRSFRYDPLRRTPPKPAVLRGHFTDADFSLGDTDVEQEFQKPSYRTGAVLYAAARCGADHPRLCRE